MNRSPIFGNKDPKDANIVHEIKRLAAEIAKTGSDLLAHEKGLTHGHRVAERKNPEESVSKKTP